MTAVQNLICNFNAITIWNKLLSNCVVPMAGGIKYLWHEPNVVHADFKIFVVRLIKVNIGKL